jgi:hypothetical protein
VRVRVIRFVPLGFASHTKKIPIKSITYQLIWANVKKLVDRVTVSFILKNIETTNTVSAIATATANDLRLSINTIRN